MTKRYVQKREDKRPDEPEQPFNWLTDMDADFCDRHETAFRMADGCPKCSAEGKSRD